LGKAIEDNASLVVSAFDDGAGRDFRLGQTQRLNYRIFLKDELQHSLTVDLKDANNNVMG